MYNTVIYIERVREEWGGEGVNYTRGGHLNRREGLNCTESKSDFQVTHFNMD